MRQPHIRIILRSSTGHKLVYRLAPHAWTGRYEPNDLDDLIISLRVWERQGHRIISMQFTGEDQ